MRGGLANPAASIASVIFVLSLSACSFEPKIPSGKIVCQNDGDCPNGQRCAATPGIGVGKLCCAGAGCGPALVRDASTDRSPAARTDASVDAPAVDQAAAVMDAGADGTNADASDVERVVPPTVMPSDAAAERPSDGADARLDPTSYVRCSRLAATRLAPQPGRKLHCTISLRESYTLVSMDVITDDDPISTFTHALCWAEPGLAAETSAPGTGAPRPLQPAALDRIVGEIMHYRRLCSAVDAPLSGVNATRWARQATNQGELRSAFRALTGIDLDIPSVEQELSQHYLGVTRQRRGRVVFNHSSDPAEVLVWKASEAAPIRHVVPIGYGAAGNQHFSNLAVLSFEEARQGLRNKVAAQLRSALDDLATGVAARTLSSQLAVGPASPTLSLALQGKLRTAAGTWTSPADFRARSSAATEMESTFGRVFASFAPDELEGFLASIDGPQFGQLRSPPLRSAYGEELMVELTLIDLVSDWIDATEVGFVSTGPHFGYLFEKLRLPLR